MTYMHEKLLDRFGVYHSIAICKGLAVTENNLVHLVDADNDQSC